MMNRAPRADAVRNRAKVLEVAAEIFATEGLSVPVHEIARRAGVGTGTVSRHFPTKEDLFAAILLGRMERLTAKADEVAAQQDPATAFLEVVTILVHEGAAHQGLADALAGSGFDIEGTARKAGFDVSGRMRDMLITAQQAGTIRGDVTFDDVMALVKGCLTRAGEGADTAPVLAVIRDGLTATQYTSDQC